jgi:glycosyltransferase involved in cell wall biosynthesis
MAPRVLWLVRGLGRGGAEALLVAFAARSHGSFEYEAAFTRPDKTDLVADLERAGVPARLLGGRTRGSWVLALIGAVRRGRYDLVHSHSPLLAALARIAARTVPRRRRPLLVATEHNVWDAYAGPTRVLNAVTFGWDDAHLAVSEEVRRSVPSRWRGQVEVLVHGVLLDEVRAHHDERDAVRSELGIGDEEVVVATVANYRVHKAWPDLLACARIVVDEERAARFVSVGQGPLADDVHARHEALNLGDRFLLLGRRSDAVRILAAADVFVLASIQEGLPVALMEALALGLPIVATNVGGIPEAVTDGVEAVLVPPGRPAELAQAVLAVVRDPARRRRMAAAAAKRGAGFDIGRAVERTEALYRGLLEERAS